MKTTTKSIYAIQALADIARHATIQKPATLEAIATRQGLTVAYLGHLMMKLRKANIVTSVRGPKGGYILKLEPSKISLLSCIQGVGEKNKQITNIGEDSSNEAVEIAHFEGLKKAHDLKFFGSMTLKDVMTSTALKVMTKLSDAE